MKLPGHFVLQLVITVIELGAAESTAVLSVHLSATLQLQGQTHQHEYWYRPFLHRLL